MMTSNGLTSPLIAMRIRPLKVKRQRKREAGALCLTSEVPAKIKRRAGLRRIGKVPKSQGSGRKITCRILRSVITFLKKKRQSFFAR